MDNDPRLRRSWQGAVLLDEYQDTHELGRQVKALGDSRRANLRLTKNNQDKWVVLQSIPGKPEGVVGIYEHGDKQMLEKLARVLHPSYELAGELERIDTERDERYRKDRKEFADAAAEPMAWATRRAQGETNRVYVP